MEKPVIVIFYVSDMRKSSTSIESNHGETLSSIYLVYLLLDSLLKCTGNPIHLDVLSSNDFISTRDPDMGPTLVHVP